MQTALHQTDRLTRARALCRANRLALTVQRRLILEATVDRTDHPTADEVFESVASRLPGLSRTTVYRVLEAFVRAKILRKIAHASAVARFDPRVERHHHLVCERCGALTDIPDTVTGPLDLSPLIGLGVQVADYCIHFTGTCSCCRKASFNSNRRERH